MSLEVQTLLRFQLVYSMFIQVQQSIPTIEQIHRKVNSRCNRVINMYSKSTLLIILNIHIDIHSIIMITLTLILHQVSLPLIAYQVYINIILY